MESFMQKQMEMQMQMMNKMMDTSATMSGNLLQTQQQQAQKTEQRLERTEDRLDNTQDKSLDYTTKNNHIDAVVSNNNRNQAPAAGFIKCMGCNTVENPVGTKFCFNCGREL
jgi:membrane protease subunit (stomatin/prohibitin family)